MEDFKIESRYVKLCYKFRAIIRCIEAAFTYQIFKNSYVLVNQKTRSSICFKTCSRTFGTIGTMPSF